MAERRLEMAGRDRELHHKEFIRVVETNSGTERLGQVTAGVFIVSVIVVWGFIMLSDLEQRMKIASTLFPAVIAGANAYRAIRNMWKPENRRAGRSREGIPLELDRAPSHDRTARDLSHHSLSKWQCRHACGCAADGPSRRSWTVSFSLIRTFTRCRRLSIRYRTASGTDWFMRHSAQHARRVCRGQNQRDCNGTARSGIVLSGGMPGTHRDWLQDLPASSLHKQLTTFRLVGDYTGVVEDWNEAAAAGVVEGVQIGCGRLADILLTQLGRTPGDVGYSDWLGDGPLAGWEAALLDYFEPDVVGERELAATRAAGEERGINIGRDQGRAEGFAQGRNEERLEAALRLIPVLLEPILSAAERQALSAHWAERGVPAGLPGPVAGGPGQSCTVAAHLQLPRRFGRERQPWVRWRWAAMAQNDVGPTTLIGSGRSAGRSRAEPPAGPTLEHPRGAKCGVSKDSGQHPSPRHSPSQPCRLEGYAHRQS